MKILVAKNKHDTDYYKFGTEEEQKAAALALFQANDDMSYYYNLDADCLAENEEELKEVNAELTKFDSTEVGLLSKMHVDGLKNKKKRLERTIDEDKKQVELYTKAKAGDAKAAWTLLKLRKDHEYEGFEIREAR